MRLPGAFPGIGLSVLRQFIHQRSHKQLSFSFFFRHTRPFVRPSMRTPRQVGEGFRFFALGVSLRLDAAIQLYGILTERIFTTSAPAASPSR